MKAESAPEDSLAWDGEERRRSPRDGEITDAHANGALARLVKEGEFTEGDSMRVALGAILEKLTAPSGGQPAQVEPASEQVAQTPLDEAGRVKVAELFNSPQAGYESYALPLLKEAKIDPANLPEGSAPLWASSEEALKELQDKLTTEQQAVIENMTDPGIVIEPIVAHSKVLVKDEAETDYDRRLVGETPFLVSEWMGKKLARQDEAEGITEATGEKIIGWRIGVVERGKPKILRTDGDIMRKSLRARAKDFHEEGQGRLGFESAMDHPILYVMMMAASRKKAPQNPMDDVYSVDGTWTMETNVNVDAKLVAGGDWVRVIGKAGLREDRADGPSGRARVRLAVMFKKN